MHRQVLATREGAQEGASQDADASRNEEMKGL
jgi:hypothetical protein